MRKLSFILSALALTGCSALMPTRDIPSADPTGSYPNIGAVPAGETKILTPEEREKLTKELEAARARNQRATKKAQ